MEDPAQGVAFRGRIGENFKLSTGTWVLVGSLRVALVDALSPLALDVVVTGHDRDAIGLLVLPGPAGRALSPADLQHAIAGHLRRWNHDHPSASERIGRAAVSLAPLSLDAGETTDKGYTNQRRVMENRAAEVEALFADPPGARVIAL